MKTWPLAELAIPSFELFSCFYITHYLVDPGSNFVHLLKIRALVGLHHLHNVSPLFNRQLSDFTKKAPREICPTILHKVNTIGRARHIFCEVFHPYFLPTRFACLLTVPICIHRLVTAYIHRGGRALAHKYLFTRCRKVRYALHCRSSRTY